MANTPISLPDNSPTEGNLAPAPAVASTERSQPPPAIVVAQGRSDISPTDPIVVPTASTIQAQVNGGASATRSPNLIDNTVVEPKPTVWPVANNSSSI